ncbi:hypothetical protein [Microbispora sp. H11081]|uniref:hypothetical protein n=1 Tax=Microbispora sp. H11081 TaxID=2729107 RepID=UPI001475E967|nr:hypothetical protein [Microbispora sp. H11081]
MVELLGAVVSLAAVAVLVLGAVVAIAVVTLVWLGAMAVGTGRESQGRAAPVPAGAEEPARDSRAGEARKPLEADAPANRSGQPSQNGSANGSANGSVKGSANGSGSGSGNGHAAGLGGSRQIPAVAASVRRA